MNLNELKAHWDAYAIRKLSNGTIIAVGKMAFTVALYVGLEDNFYERRYCYESLTDALTALVQWDGVGDPPGPWIKEKPSERFGPGALNNA